jgi:hypothetical protein
VGSRSPLRIIPADAILLYTFRHWRHHDNDDHFVEYGESRYW